MNKHSECRKALDLLERYHDGELNASEFNMVKEHLESCVGCSTELESMKEIDRIGSINPFPEPDKKFWENQGKEIISEISKLNIKKTAVVKEHWTKKFFGPAGIRIASGIAAAVLIIFAVSTQVGYLDRSEKTPEMAALFTPEEQTGGLETAQDESKVKQPGTVQQTDAALRGKTEESLVSEEIPAAIPEQTDVIATEPGANEDVAADIKDRLILPEQSGEAETPSEEAISLAEGLSNVPTATTETNRELRRNAANRPFTAVQSLRLPKVEAEEFNAYLYNKDIISFETDLNIQKECWQLFLENVNGKTVSDLAVNEIYDIYNKIITSESDKELKAEALEFMKTHREILIVRLGESRYQNTVRGLERIQG